MSIHPVVIPNSVKIGSVEEFEDNQNVLKEPMVLVMDWDSKEYIEHFNIVAKDYEEFLLMDKMKIFYTSSIPKGETVKKYGAIFYGVSKYRNRGRKKKARSGATKRAI